MKKLLLVLVLALGLTSCEKEKVVVIIEAQQKADVRLNVKASSNTASRNDVNRGDIPVMVSDIGIRVESIVTGITLNELFNIVDDGSGEDGFVIEDVSLGNNTFYASTDTDVDEVYNSKTNGGNNNTLSEKLSQFRESIPFVLYTGNALSNIDGDNDFVEIQMNTQNGRLLTGVEMVEEIQDDYYYTVTISTTNNAEEVINVGGSKNFTNEWSDYYSVEGASLTIQFNIYSKLNDALSFTSEEFQIDVKASKGITTIFTLSADSVQQETLGLNFVFQEWTEEGNI